MEKVMIVLIVVMLAFAMIYIALPGGVPGAGTSIKIADMPPEGNGMLGRVIDGLAELTWHPAHMVILMLMAGAFSAGMAVYWKTIKD